MLTIASLRLAGRGGGSRRIPRDGDRGRTEGASPFHRPAARATLSDWSSHAGQQTPDPRTPKESASGPTERDGRSANTFERCAKAGSQDSGTANGKDGIITVQGVVGPLEPDASGHTIRHTAKGVEYVVFTMGRNGSMTPVYSNQPGMAPEITRRQGRDAVARVAVVQDNGRQYYVLSGFVEG